MKAEFKYLVLGAVATNCYFLADRQTKEMILIDPADSPSRIQTVVDRNGYKPCAVLLTHGHFDHIGAVDELRKKWQVPVYAGEAEEEILRDPSQNLSSLMGSHEISTRADRWLKDGDILDLAGFTIQVISTPGHTIGGVSYYIPEEKALFSGDTLFEGSCGRTDFPTGSASQIIRSIREKLFVLPEDTAVFPGHGSDTTIGYEKKYNYAACVR